MPTFGNGRRVAIVRGIRTPFTKAGTVFKSLSAIDLGKIAVTELLPTDPDLGPEELTVVLWSTFHGAVALEEGLPDALRGEPGALCHPPGAGVARIDVQFHAVAAALGERPVAQHPHRLGRVAEAGGLVREDPGDDHLVVRVRRVADLGGVRVAGVGEAGVGDVGDLLGGLLGGGRKA